MVPLFHAIIGEFVTRAVEFWAIIWLFDLKNETCAKADVLQIGFLRKDLS